MVGGRMKRILTIGVILLFIGMSISSPTGFNLEKQSIQLNGKILYVGGSGPGNYTKIQDAIDDASDGDTVFVYNGTYSDFFSEKMACVRIEKTINLVGEDKYNTIINGSDVQRVIIINADGVNISGFTLQNGGTPTGRFGVGVDVWRQSNICINDNIITENLLGIWLEDLSANILIYDNIITGNNEGIETMGRQSNIKIYNNTIAHNSYGAILSPQTTSIYENNISNNSIGLLLLGGDSESSVYRNQIQNNFYGLSTGNSQLTIQYNNFINNTKHAKIYKDQYLLNVLKIPFIRQYWGNNYWDDWQTTNPKPIHGTISIYIQLIVPGGFFDVLLGKVPYVQFDWHPAQEPYDIEV
jgi:parallel beta-helix repeat protein